MDRIKGSGTDKLRIGDIITLKHAKPNEGWLSAEGVINIDSVLARDNSVIENCLWQVTVQSQYSACSEYEDALLGVDGGDDIIRDAPQSERSVSKAVSDHELKLTQLKRTAMNEQRLNKKLMAMKIGKPITFGDVIQLLHVKSKKFLTISMSSLAKHERENMRVYLKEGGDAMSWVEFMPRYKYDRVGQQIVNENECFIRVHERSSEYIHAARKASKTNPDGNKEINCSLESSIWTISIFQQAKETKSKHMLAGQLVSLQEPETSTYLTLDQQKPGLTQRANVIMSNSIQLSFAASDCNVGTNLLWMVEFEDMCKGGPVGNRSGHIALRDLNTGLYMKMEADGVCAVKNRRECSLFEVVSSQQVEVGTSIVEGSLIHLCCRGSWVSLKRAGSSGIESHCTGAKDRSVAISLVVSPRLHQNMGVDIYVGVEAASVLRRFHTSVTSLCFLDQPMSVAEAELKNVFVCLEYLLVFLKSETNSDQFDVSLCNLLGFEQGQLKAELEPMGGATVVTRQTMMREQGILDVLLDIIQMSQAESDDEDDLSSGRVPADHSNRSLGRSTGTGRFTSRRSFYSSLRGVGRPRSSTVDSISATSDGDLTDICFHVLYLCLNNNHINQMHIADRFPILLNQVKDQEYAVACVQEILRDNLQMLQTKVSDREIRIFLDLLEESPMNVTLLKLLRSTCSSPSGVDNTQRMVASALYGDRDVKILQSASLIESILPAEKQGSNSITWSKSSPISGFDINAKAQELSASSTPFSKLVIDLQANYTTLRKANWTDMRIYMPTEEHDLAEVLGLSLVRNGLPRMMVKWECTFDCDFNMQLICGKNDPVPLEYLTDVSKKDIASLNRAKKRLTINTEPQALSSVRKQPSTSPAVRKRRHSGMLHKQGSKRLQNRKTAHSHKVKTIVERKVQISEYFIAQMYLAADLCLDRNYVSIGLLEQKYTIDALLTLLRSSTNPPRIRAPICKLIRTLYVDREPQIAARFPRLVKTSVSLGGGVEDSFSDHHSGSPFTFAVLQHIISQYLHNDLDTTDCNELTAEMMELLFSLVEFGFYHTPEHLQDITVPLVQALEDHRSKEMHEDNKKEFRRRSSSLAFWNARNTRGSVSAPQKSHDNSGADGGEGMKKSETNTSTENSAARERSKSVAEVKALRIANSDTSIPLKKESVTWQQTMLNHMESVTALMLILALVIGTSVYSVLQLVLNLEVTRVIARIDFAVSMIFLSELSARMYCYATVHKQLSSFIKSPLNQLDIVVVIFDIVLLGLDAQFLGNAASFRTSLKTVRILRLIRVFRAARLLKKIADRANVSDAWVIPERYSKTTVNEVRTLAGILRILSQIHTRIQDRKLTCAIKAFVEWYEADMQGKYVDARETYLRIVSTEQTLDEAIPKKFDQTLIDVAMYKDPNLVKEALRILLLHKSQNDLLYSAMRNLQIIYTPKMEMKYKNIINWLKQLQRLAEAFEVWSDMESPQELAAAQCAHDALVSIRDYVKVKPMMKDFDLNPVALVDTEIQQVLLNLDAMTCFMSLQAALLDASLGDPHAHIKRIVLVCNDLIADFVNNNEVNQAVAFKHMEWFLDRVDDGVHSSRVVRSILAGNRYLIKQCQRRYLAEFMQKIVTNGRKPEYLDLFVGMTDINDTGDSGVSALHSEIARYITNGERSSHILLWCCSPDSLEYKSRIDAMEPYRCDTEVPDEDELSSDLQYHIRLLTLLAGCKLGPKLQAVYQLDDAVAAILDSNTIPHVRNALLLLVVEMVNTRVESMEASESLWQLFEHFTTIFTLSEQDLSNLMIKSENHRKLFIRIEWLNHSLEITRSFFHDFDFDTFNELTSYENDESFITLTKKTEVDIRLIITHLFTSIKRFLDRHSTVMSKNTKGIIESTLQCWSDFVDDAHHSNSMQANPRRRTQNTARRASIVAEIQQVFYRKQFAAFVDIIAPTVTHSSSGSGFDPQSLELLEKIPSVYDNVVSDVRLEPFFLKMTTHLRNQLERTTSARYLDKSSVDTSIWIMTTLRHIIEKNIEVSVETIADPLTHTEVFEVSYFHTVMDEYGVTYLCLDIISIGIDSKLCVEAVKLLVALLCKFGGHTRVQRSIYQYLSNTDSTLFFEELKELLEQLQVWCQRDAENASDPDLQQNTSLPSEIFVLKLISSMCDGNFSANKNIMREQEGNSRFVNILDHLTGFVDLLSRIESPFCTKVAVRVIHTILCLMHGPCKGSQEYFVLHTELLTALNRLIRQSRPSLVFTLEWQQDVEILKEYIIDVLRASIEGLKSDSVVLERIQTAIEVNVLNMIILPPETDEFGFSVDIDSLSRLQAKHLVFLKSTDDKNVEMPSNALACIENDIASVEVVWNQQLHRHYFHIPGLAKDLSESSKRKITEEVDFLTQEIKLNDFLRKARELHREGVHQEALKSFGIVHLWAWKGILAKTLLVNVIIMNILLTMHFTVKPQSESSNFYDPVIGYIDSRHLTSHTLQSGSSVSSSPYDIYLPMNIYNIIHALNGIHIALVMLTMTIILVVRVPLMYACHIDAGKSRLLSAFYAIIAPTPLWYFVHTLIAWIAFYRNPLLLSCLLLEFVAVDSATKEVMLAVVNPLRQLLTTIAIILIFIHIFASAIFVFFRDEFLHLVCNSLWQSFKLMVSYGFRSEEGIGRYMNDTIGIRIIVDVAFYFIIVVILRNIFFGIIIDTFGELRGVKMDREMDMNGRCFICGIDQQEFDKRAANSCDFKTHRSEAHNMWNYLYFVMRIWQQPRSQDTSLELYVRQCMENDDVSWFPVGLVGMTERDDSENAMENSNVDNEEENTLSPVLSRRRNQDIDDSEMDAAVNLKLMFIQDRLSHMNLHRLPDTSSTPVLTPEVKQLIEKAVDAEISPIQSALEEALNEVNNLVQRLHEYEALGGRKRRAVTQGESRNRTASKSDGVAGPKLCNIK